MKNALLEYFFVDSGATVQEINIETFDLEQQCTINTFYAASHPMTFVELLFNIYRILWLNFIYDDTHFNYITLENIRFGQTEFSFSGIYYT